MTDMLLPVTKIQHFCTQDGPGVRTTVFLKGCPLRCVWCHNPETQGDAPSFFYTDALCIRCGACAAVCERGVHSIAGDTHTLRRDACRQCMRCTQVCVTGALDGCCTWLTAEAILAEIVKDAAFYGENGGVTLSGGEPTVHADGVLSLLALCRANGIRTAMETCGYFDPALLPRLADGCDLFLWDVKDTDDSRHTANTGVSNRTILDNLMHADALGAKTVLRCILLRSVNLDAQHLQNIIRLFRSLRHCGGVTLIPYHTYGASKGMQLGLPDRARKDWIPAAEEIAQAEAYLRRHDVPIVD